MGKRARDSSVGRISRREFFKKSFSLATALGASSLVARSAAKSEATNALSSAALANLSISGGSPSLTAATAPSVSRDLSRALVILARRANRGDDVQAFYKILLDASLKRLASTARPEDAWAKFFKPDDVVAIKVNAITGKRLSTSPALVKAIADGLVSCGIRPDKIIIWDRTTWELDAAGFQINFAKDRPLFHGV
jgi:hypothetical protein